MKKLKFLLIPLISLLFIINVNAAADVNYNYNNLTALDNYLTNNPNKTMDDFIDELYESYINTNIIPNITSSKYIIALDNYDNYDWTKLKLLVFESEEYNIKQYRASNPPYYLQLDTGSNGGYKVYHINFNSNYSSYTISYYTRFGGSYSIMSAYSNRLLSTLIIGSNFLSIPYGPPTGTSTNSFSIKGNGEYIYNNSEVPISDFTGNYTYQQKLPSQEPTYSYTTEVLENGNVRVNFTFSNYNVGNYAFEIENAVSNEEYGITNPFLNIFPKIIPYGNSYSIEIYFDTLLYITLSKYEQIEQSSLYYKNELYTDIIDINNVVFENTLDPYFMIQTRTKNNITGRFYNTTSDMTCWSRYSDSQTEQYVDCNDGVGFSFQDNGYVEVIIKRGNNVIYSRKINYIGNDTSSPYIVYEINKQDFYSVINWYIENEEVNSTYRYSIDNGQNFTAWISYNSNNNKINVFDNNTIIIEIANNNQSTIYDSKSIVVVNDISEIKNINNTTINFLDKFRNIFSVNTNILSNINNFYDNIKVSKIYLLIFIPFLASLIGAIIYLIRRK